MLSDDKSLALFNMAAFTLSGDASIEQVRDNKKAVLLEIESID